jgi:hypothetical protein
MFVLCLLLELVFSSAEGLPRGERGVSLVKGPFTDRRLALDKRRGEAPAPSPLWGARGGLVQKSGPQGRGLDSHMHK